MKKTIMLFVFAIMATSCGAGAENNLTALGNTRDSGINSPVATSTTTLPAWCNKDNHGSADPHNYSYITNTGATWTANCAGQTWTLTVNTPAFDSSYVEASAVNLANPSMTANYIGTMSAECVYLVPDNVLAPTIIGTKITLTNTSASAVGPNCTINLVI